MINIACIPPQLTGEAEERAQELSKLQEQAVKNQQMTQEIEVSRSDETRATLQPLRSVCRDS